MAFRPRLVLVLVTGILIGVSLTLGADVLAGRRAAAPAGDGMLAWEDARLLAEVLHRVETEYVDGVTEHDLMDAAVRGMVSALDEHSAFLDSEEYAELQESTAGSYPGIGIEVEAAEGGVRVLRPVPGAPAARAGVKAGDLIVSIDDEPVGEDVEEAIGRMRGREGTQVRLAIHREGRPSPLQFSLRRRQVEVHSVASRWLEPGYGYLRIAQFTETTVADAEAAIRELTAGRGDAPLDGLVLDLRDNPGGLLDAAVALADDFLEGGNIVSAEGRTEEARFRMDAEAGELLPGTPIVVLVNGNSASAAEILAGALRDNGRARLVGRKTYGKGSVQTILPLADGQALKLTTSRYFTPSGASINQVGLLPDLTWAGEETAPPEPDDPAATAAASRDGELRFALAALKTAGR